MKFNEAVEFNETELKYKELESKFELFRNIMNSGNKAEPKVNLNEADMIVNEILPDMVKKKVPPNFNEMYFDFKYEYSKFKDFVQYGYLAGKNIVAIGGRFNSGKSSFLNSLMEKPVYSQQIDSFISVPTYIIGGETTGIYGINIFGSKIQMKLDEIPEIFRGDAGLINKGEKVISKKVKLGHMFRSIFLKTPFQPYKNIAFLNTIEYFKSNMDTSFEKSNEKIVRTQLNSSNYIIWIIQSDADIDEEIRFINTLKEEIPKLIIVNKTDNCAKEDIEKISSEIKDKLHEKESYCMEVLVYSSRKYDEFDNNRIRQYIEIWDDGICDFSFAYNFNTLFKKCKEYYKNAVKDESKSLDVLNKIISSSDDTELNKDSSLLISKINKNIDELNDASLKLKNIQNKFFTEIKYAADVIGISMPDPSEIDLLKDKITTSPRIVKEYMKKHGIKSDVNIGIMIYNAFEDIIPVINEEAGGLNYRKELFNIIEQNLVVEKERVKFNDKYNDVNEFVVCINNTLG